MHGGEHLRARVAEYALPVVLNIDSASLLSLVQAVLASGARGCKDSQDGQVGGGMADVMPSLWDESHRDQPVYG